MKIDSKPIVVKLESPDGDAILTFKGLKGNTYLKIQVELEEAKKGLKSEYGAYKELLANCLSVENLTDEDGTITAEKVRNIELPISLIHALVIGYINAASKRITEAEPKNDLSLDS